MVFENIGHIPIRIPQRVLSASRGGGMVLAGYEGVRVAGDNGSERCSEGVPRHILSGSKGKSVIPSKDIFQLAGEGAGGAQNGWEER